MKRFFILWVFILPMLLTTACSSSSNHDNKEEKEKNNTEKLLMGRWNDGWTYFHFTQDHTLYFGEAEELELKWSLKGKKLSLFFPDDPEAILEFKITSISSGELILVDEGNDTLALYREGYDKERQHSTRDIGFGCVPQESDELDLDSIAIAEAAEIALPQETPIAIPAEVPADDW